ncbi:sentrin-specific protease 3-like [Daktulosphaira vitifoliae]|uniref:sentrin-specific protease 3-like n=1 Tax=Daktulosphaira vitifoliae TaxID=58002 RepID=UPI0021AAFB2E|nr:sentrin-specific protease 3-like [Daktulosphaira vitifoliae]
MSLITDTSLYNDETINRFMKLLMKRNEDRIFAFDTFFIPEINRRELDTINTRFKENLLLKTTALAPIHINNNHWIIAVDDIQQHEIICYDSLDCHDIKEITKFRQFMIRHELRMSGSKSMWPIFRGETTIQENNYDCGPWILEIAVPWSQRRPKKLVCIKCVSTWLKAEPRNRSRPEKLVCSKCSNEMLSPWD